MKRFLTVFILAIGLVLITGCMSNSTLVSISVEDKNIEVALGDVYVVNPQIVGLKETPLLSYSSNNPAVFQVDQNGVIEPVSVGIANLIVELLNVSGIKLKMVVSIVEDTSSTDPTTDNPDINPGPNGTSEDVKLLIANGDLNIEVGENVNLQVLVDGNEFLGEVVWVSSNTKVATVDNDGTLTAIAPGTVIISVVVGRNVATINVNIREKSNPTITVEPTSVTVTGPNWVNEESIAMLTATPNVNTDSKFNWTTDNPNVATVDANGVVIGVSAGVATIKATLIDYPTVFGTFTILVKEVATSASPITSITLTGATEVLQGNKILVRASWSPSNEPATFTYSSSNEAVLTVDQNGWVTGVAGGSAQVIATLNGDAEKNATFNVTVIPLPTEILITGSSTVSVTQNIVLTATSAPAGSSAAVTWSSSNTAIATVDTNGRVTGVAAGTVTITASSLINSNIKGTFNVTVTDQRSITLTPTTVNLAAGNSQTITATVFAASLTDKSVVWSSGNTAVATVDANGKVTGISAGTATIIAKLNADNTVQAQATVTVTAALKPTITISDATASLTVGGTKNLTATVSNTSNTSVTWASSNTAVATVANGVVTAKAAGTATITATAVADTSVRATCAVTVTAAPAGTLTITQSPTGTIPVGASGYTLYVNDSSGASISRLECTFSSSNSSVATVSQYGTISALKAGTATITVAHTKGTGSITLTVSGSGDGSMPSNMLTITADPSATVPVGGSGYQLYIRDSGGTAVSRTECTFTSSNSSVATVSSYGTISALSAGTAKITVTHPSKGTGTITLTVTSSSPTPPSSGPIPSELAAAFALVDKYSIATTFSRYVMTYGEATETQATYGSVNYLRFGGSNIDTSTFYRWHSTAPGRKYIAPLHWYNLCNIYHIC